MAHKLAFVLGGGGGRGALQAGALRALWEAGIKPDLLVGTSIGAANAAFLALLGYHKEGLDRLEHIWRETAKVDLLPSNYLWLTIRRIFELKSQSPDKRIRDFVVSLGLTEDLKFADFQDISVLLVSTDLNSHQPICYGTEPQQSVLEGVLASTAIPPWIHPLEREGRYEMDGGVVSNLPLEAAMDHQARKIIALDLLDPRDEIPFSQPLAPLLNKLMVTVQQRQMDLELRLARARGISVHYVSLLAEKPHPVWDFSRAEELMERGFSLMKEAMASWEPERRSMWPAWLKRLA
jgi:NTE family protein